MMPSPARPRLSGAPAPEGRRIAALQRALLGWYGAHHRDLPWRRRGDAYGIWVSEIMLQQTQVDTVIPYFERFMARFPRVEDLAASDEQAVLSLWAGLGYYARARNLRRGAQVVVAEFGGALPEAVADLRRIPGIGPYTAGAISSIAYGRPAAILDGNVARVLSRIFCLEGDPKSTAGRKILWHLAEMLVPDADPSSFNQGLMELGALVCTPSSPRCPGCPLAKGCEALAAGRVAELPVKSPTKARPHVDMVALILRGGGPEGPVLLARRPSRGLLGGLWEFPLIPVDGGASAGSEGPRQGNIRSLGDLPPWQGAPSAATLRSAALWRVGLPVDLATSPQGPRPLGPVEHLFTHLSARIFGIPLEVSGPLPEPRPRPPARVAGLLVDYEAFEWVEAADLDAYPMGKIADRLAALLRSVGEAQLSLI